MTTKEAAEYATETNRIAQANHQRALDSYDLIFPPWRWPRWWREHRAIQATMSEVRRRMDYLSEQA